MPLVIGDEPRGVLSIQNIDRENAFTDSDFRLLITLAGSLSVAFENARLFDETQRLLKETEQRAAELAVINRIQEGMAAELDFQAIIDLVGDKLREVFRTGDIGIRWYDAKANILYCPYDYEHGVRLDVAPMTPPPGGVWSKLVQTRQPIVSNNPAEAAALGAVALPGTDTSLSSVRVPILGSDRVLGSIILESFERENAYGESEVRLLSTVAASMGVALENARLFDETQRLFKTEQQRAAELAIINSVQEGLAAQLDFQAIIDLVGDKIREIFDSGDMSIAFLDRQSNLVTMPYYCEHGERFPVSPFPLGGGLAGDVIQTRQPLVINHDFQRRAPALGAKPIGDTDAGDAAQAMSGCRSFPGRRPSASSPFMASGRTPSTSRA